MNKCKPQIFCVIDSCNYKCIFYIYACKFAFVKFINYLCNVIILS